MTRHLPLSPRVRRLIATLVLGSGALWVGRSLVGVAPRDVTVQVRLGQYRDPPDVARAITVMFSRNGEPVRELSERFTAGPPPLVWQRALSIPPGSYAATVTVELQGRSGMNTQSLVVHPGDMVELNAPPPP